MSRRFCPHHRDIGNWAVGDPHFSAGQAVAAVDFFRPGNHVARVGAVVGLGQTKAAHHLAAGQLRQEFLLLLFRAIRFDGVHHQRRLHAHRRTVTGIHTFDFTGNQAVGHVINARAAVLGGNGRAQQAKLAHFGHDLAVKTLFAEGGQHAGLKVFLAVIVGGIADLALFVGELLFQ